MKNLFYTFIACIFAFSAKGQVDTVSLIVDPVIAINGEKPCVALRTRNFNHIVSAQFGLQWDSSLLHFETINAQALIGGNYNLLNNGELLYTWFDQLTIGYSVPDNESLIEICFTALTDVLLPTNVKATSLANFRIEVINVNDEQLVVQTGDNSYDSGELPSENCSQVSYCKSNLIVEYSGDTVKVFPEELIDGSLERFLVCTQVNAEEIVIVNLSDSPPSIGTFAQIHCGNLKETMHLGLAIKSEPGPSYWVHCIVPVQVINSSGSNCGNDSLSPSDPSICKDVEFNAVDTESSITNEQLLNIDIPPTIEYTYLINGGYWEYTQFMPEIPLKLLCDDYNQSINYTTSLFIAPPESPGPTERILIPEFCTHEIIVHAEEQLCDNVLDNNQTLLTIQNIPKNQPVQPLLNEEILPIIAEASFIIDNDKIRDFENVISINEQIYVEGATVSTLDIVYMVRVLMDIETLVGEKAIAADLDRSGSLSTKDIIVLRKYVLGLLTEFPEGMNYLIDTRVDLSHLDFLNFENIYRDYRFDKSDLTNEEAITLSLGMLGDVFGSKSAKGNSVKMAEMSFDDEYVVAGQTVTKKITFSNQNSPNFINGLSFGLSNEFVQIDDLKATSSTMSVLNVPFLNDERFSIVDISASGNLEVEVQLTPRKNGWLSSLLVLSEYNHEVITSDYSSLQLQIVPKSSSVDQLELFPNPASDRITIKIPNDKIGGQICIYDVLGKSLVNKTIVDNSMIIESAELKGKGLYFARISNNSEVVTTRFFME